MSIPGFGAEASLYRTAVPHAAAASEQNQPEVYPAQAGLRWESVLTGGWRDFAGSRVIPPECPFPLVPRWVEPCKCIRIPPWAPTCTSFICGPGSWECQAPTLSIAQ